jgi:hypothetical protein
MSLQIHMRESEGGQRFRLWSTSWDKYVAEELTESDLVDVLRGQALREFERELVNRMERVITNGTSTWGESRDVTGPWDEERDE